MRRIGMLNILSVVVLTGAAALASGCVGEEGHVDLDRSIAQPLDEDVGSPDKACTSVTLGDGAICQTYDLAKEQANAACQAAGQLIADITFQTEGCADGTWSQAAVECCAAPPPAPPPGVCSQTVVGDGAACQEESFWKQAIFEACDDQGLQVWDMTFAKDCPDGSSTNVEVSCCEAPPAPQDSCVATVIGDGAVCESASSIKQQAVAFCDAQQLTLVGVGLASDCPNDGSTMAKVLCCESAIDPANSGT